MSAIKSAAGLLASENSNVIEVADRLGAPPLLAGQKLILEMIATGAPLADTLEELTRFIEEQEPGLRCGILLVTEDGEHFRRGGGLRLPEAYHDALDGAPITPPYLGPCSEAAHKGASVVVSNIANDARWSDEWRSLVLSCGLAACRSTPVFAADGSVLASFAMYYRQPCDPHPDKPELVDIATHLAGIAISRERSEAELRQGKEQLQKELAATRHLQEISTLLIQEGDADALYHRLLDAAIVVMGSDMASMQLLDRARGELRLLAWKGFHPASAEFWQWVGVHSESTCGEALKTGRRVVVADVETCDFMAGAADLREYLRSGIHAVQSTPLISRSGQVLGMISTHWRDRHQPSEGDFRLFDLLTRQAADLIERASTEQALRERTEQLEAVLETAPAGVWFTHDREVRHATGNRHAAAMFRTGDEANLSLTALAEEERPPIVICRDGRPLGPDDLPLQRAARGEPVAEEELDFRYPDGGGMTVLLRASTLRGSTGEPTGAVAAAIDITARKRAEDALRESEKRFREMADNAPMMIWVTDTSDQCTFMSRTWHEFTGQPVEEALGRGWLDCIHPDDRERVDNASRAAAPRPVTFREEYRLRHRDGGWRWAIDAAAPRFDAASVFLGHIGSVVDITERIEIELALRDREERLRAIFDSTSVGAAILTPTRHFLEVNEAFCSITGYSAAELKRSDCASLTHPDDRPKVGAQIEDLLAGRKTKLTLEKRYIRKDGAIIWVQNSASLTRDAAGQPMHLVLLCQDISERKRAEEALREADLRKDIALGAGRMGVWDWDIASGRLVWDDAEFAIYGVERGSFTPTNESFESFMHPEDRGPFKAAQDAALETAAPLDIEFRILRPDGQERWISERAVILTDAAGKPVRMTGVSYDVTDRKKAEERRNLLINELNHRVKNTLATVQSIASQTLKNSDAGPAIREAFESRLISLSKAHDVLTRRNWEGARLDEIAMQSLQPFQGEGEPRITVSGPEISLSPKAALALSMAFHELATNAVKYGALSREAGQVRLEWAAEGQLLRIAWSESGGPLVETPRRKGFGSRLIERSLAAELGGTVRMDHARSGVRCLIEAPLSNVAG